MTIATHRLSILLAAALFAWMPISAHAADAKVAGWIPYWAASKGMSDAKKHFSELDTVYLFAYAVKRDGSLNDLMKLSKSSAKRFVASATTAGVSVLPTVMWSDTNSIDAILSNPSLRAAHEDAIVAMVEKGDYDGVDIDYEGKKADTKDSFSAFLTELKAKLGDKTLSCTIEARTPPDSLYAVVPETIRYANDLAIIGKVCDVVNVMTYDQQRADLKLNKARQGAPYYPVADPDWVEKVAKLMTASIPKEKLMLGVATYGREVVVTVSPDWYQSYKQVRAVNPDTAASVAKKAKATASRNGAGELSFSYLAKKNKKVSGEKAPPGTPAGNEIAAKALAYANKTGETTTFNLVWWSDAEAIAKKASLAEAIGLRGVAIFKIDGGEDKALWKAL